MHQIKRIEAPRSGEVWWGGIKNFNIPARTSIIYPKKLTVPAVQDLLSLL